MDGSLQRQLALTPNSIKGHVGLRLPALGSTQECDECGTSFKCVRRRQRFCKEPCKKAYLNRAATRGIALMDLLMAWRKSRGAKGTWGNISVQMDRWIAEDRERVAKRPQTTGCRNGTGTSTTPI